MKKERHPGSYTTLRVFTRTDGKTQASFALDATHLGLRGKKKRVGS